MDQRLSPGPGPRANPLMGLAFLLALPLYGMTVLLQELSSTRNTLL